MEIIRQYIIQQIDFGTILLLFCLMAVVASLSRLGYMDYISNALLKKVKSLRELVNSLVVISFLFSMFLTNDVVLIILVPFTISILRHIGQDKIKIRVLVLETIAANLGSMLTPIGNPQNLYLYQYYKMDLFMFYKTLLPFGVLALILLILCGYSIKDDKIEQILDDNVCVKDSSITCKYKKIKTLSYLCLFFLCFASVLDLVSKGMTFMVVLIIVLCLDYRALKEVNYGLLGKFVALFILVGNLADVTFIRGFLQSVVGGNEVIVGIISSQCLSNVPAAVMLSRFTEQGMDLLLGVNIGGLGTLIASMASMITYDFFRVDSKKETKKYIKEFTLFNLGFLCIMIIFYFIEKIVL